MIFACLDVMEVSVWAWGGENPSKLDLASDWVSKGAKG